MKKMRTILTGTMLVLTLSMLTACGNNGNTTSDEVEKETGDTTEKIDPDKNKQDENDTPEVSREAERNDNADDAALDNGDTVSEGTGNKDRDTAVTQEEINNSNNDGSDGTVAGDLGNGVKDLGDGVGDAVEDVGDAVGNALDGDEQRQ